MVSLWPLVALTGDGATEGAVLQARDAIQGRGDLPEDEKADHLAILWFVSEAEDVPTAVIRRYLTEEKLMESSLYRGAIEKGKAEGLAGVVVRGLTNHLGLLEPAVCERIHAVTSAETLDAWCSELLLLRDAEGARRLVNKIMSTTAR